MVTMRQVPPRSEDEGIGLRPDDLEILQEVERRVLWLSTLMVHHANNVRPNPDKPTKVGGHQASSASVVTILTALYFHFLRAGDRISVKPHASPVFHACQYLLGNLDRKYLTTLREFGGLQSYPSRTKDPDPVDFSTGSVGLGAVAPVFAALASKYAELKFGSVTSNRFVALMGDAELDEGNVWETVAEEAIQGLGNVIWIVDLNRQSLDRVIPGIKAARLKRLFAGAGWHVLEAKYGTSLESVMRGPHGAALRDRIDSMSNEEYQALIRVADGADLRRRLADVADRTRHNDILVSVADVPDEMLQTLVGNLGGHDLPKLIQVLNEADRIDDAPVVIFAYTVKGYGLAFAGDPLNHSQLLTNTQMEELRAEFGIREDDPWSAFERDSPAGQWCMSARQRQAPVQSSVELDASNVPHDIEVRHPKQTSSQEAFGRTLLRIGELPEIGERVVTMSPDVATSTHLAGWINKSGVFALEEAHDFESGAQRMLRWRPSPRGQHIELGISEMNLFMALSQFGLTQELSGQPLIPIGTVYDPFVCRGLDALIYGLYIQSRMIFAGTPAGVSLSPEGGAHQSTVTPSLGIELPNLLFYEPAFGQEVDWVLLEALRQCCDREHGQSTYLRLSTKPIDQTLLDEPLQRLGLDALRRSVLAGGYRLIDRNVVVPHLPDGDVVHIAAGGMMVPEAVEAAHRLHDEGVAANVINVTSVNRLYHAVRTARRAQLADAHAPLDLGILEALIPEGERRAPIVTVQDAASHSMSFLGSIWGVPVVPLGVDEFGQSGARQALYQQVGIDADRIFNAGLLALDLAQQGDVH
ncbi:MAG TPA: 1-deoxy-D-xylulose-5-phosphate synthase N-terminal domain-containing protein [Thermomicrobiales bacterium]|nr:1-deoxy-D-xylulose-5-phosphate synthase N-terminal domain-containing protein [Thermomicrobiales bacterium]